MAIDPWNPEEYEKYRHERSQPFWDLVSLVKPQRGMRIIDLGCGTGELTQGLHRTLEALSTLGVDSSAAMLEKSREFREPGLSFKCEDIAAFTPEEPVDLLFSNAALHWIPDHKTLIPRLARFVGPGGQIAIQVPANDDQPSHTVAKRVASEEPFRTALGGFVMTSSTLGPERYAALLWQSGLRDLHVRLQVYTHELAAPGDVVDWVKGTLLTAYRKRLNPDLYSEFLARYATLLLHEVQGGSPFLFTFKRILVWGRR
ncbi:MAG TPA: methyltransferase domain-containing protein [Thermoanaerobaculia bacterium]|nr:methyltransferase domain-containing protein [Thermoanaerobaculia bacterium]